MKKLIYCALALAAGFLAASCQQENLEPAGQGDYTVTYTVEAPMDVQTKAIADGLNVDELIYEVWWTSADETRDLSKAQRLYQGRTTMIVRDGVNKGTVTLNLVKDQHYTILFWAQVEGTGVYNTENLVSVHYNSTDPEAYYANDEALAAFYAVDFVNDGVAKNSKVFLKRPFAQVNLATLNERDPKNNPIDYNITLVNSKMTLKQVPTQFNVATSETSGDAELKFKYNGVPSTTVAYTKAENNAEYYYAGMNYVFAGENLELRYDIQTRLNGSTNLATITNTILNVPVRENYRTNIVGNLLTSSTEYEVIVDADWAGDDLAPDALFLAAANGGEVTLTEDVKLTTPLVVNSEMTINLNGKTISGEFVKGNGAVVNIADGASVILNGGTIKSIAANGDAAINNEGTLVLNGVTIEGAPLADGGYSAYALISSGNMVIEEGTVISADRGSIKVTGAGETVINGGTFTNNDISPRSLTSHVVDVEDESTHKLTINGGTFQHLHTTTSGGVVICNRTKGTVYVNGGNFSGGNYYGNDNLSDYGYGGTFSVKGGVFSANPAAKYIADGYKSVLIDANYHVLPNVVADAATAANVTAVTESTADVATALATNNGEATMFMWNDVAYIAKYGEVIITSSADEATTSRGIVEGAAGLTSATVAEGIEVVSNRTFRKCANLETVVFPNTLTEIGPAVFQSCSKLENVTIPAGVTTIGEGAFAECTSLKSINIPDDITRIEKNTFNASGIESIEFHEGVTYFGAQAFRDCKQLTEVIINAPEFTMESNTFGVMAAPYPTMTIYVANAEMKAYVESNLTAHAKTYITVVAPEVVSTTTDLQAAASEGKNVVLADDLTVTSSEMVGAPYGNKTAVVHNGGVFDGNGKTLNMTIGGDNYVIMTNGGTIKNVTIDKGFRGVVVMSANQTVKLENVVCSGDVCYALNTAEGDSTQDLVATNCTFDGWSSWSLLKSATFTNCSFGQGEYYTNVTGRLGKPYVNTLFDGCEFCSKFYIDLSALGAEQKVTLKNCTVNGVKLTTENWSSLVAPEDTCGEGQISIELKNGTYMTADNVADYVVFE